MSMEKYRTALITGASSGIGEAYATALAQQGLDLILVARSRDRLDNLARALAKAHGIKVAVIAADLQEPGCGAALAKEVSRRRLHADLVINNAGFGMAGAFAQNDPVRHQQMIALNVNAVVDIAHAFLPPMLERGSGALINVASLAGFQPTPYMTVYGATKAFVLSFSEGLWAECRGKGVRVLAVCPGPVDTPFFEATGKGASLRKTVPRGTMITATQVVAESLRALRQGRSFVIPGIASKAIGLLPRLLPRRLIAAGAARAMKR